MATRQFTLVSQEFDNPILRTIALGDQELLREWKNSNRFSFFFQGIIRSEDQAKWFQGYETREHDWMFLVLALGEPIGCMGFRLLQGEVDIYNVILGKPEMGKRGLMRNALRLMCSYSIASVSSTITAKVLRDNSAVGWYEKSGFRPYAEHDTWLDLKLDPAQFQPCKFESRD